MVERIPTWTSHAKASTSGIARSPDVEHVGAVGSHVSSHRAPGDDVTHSECSDAIKGKIAARFERDGVALADFLHRDQRHFRENLFILGFATNSRPYEPSHRTNPSAAAACSNSVVSHLSMALLMDPLLGLQRRKSRVRTRS